MGPGHLGVGFAAKAFTPKTPLWLLLIASEVSDILFFILSAIGVEKKGIETFDFVNGVRIIKNGYISWSHGLGMNIILALLVSIIGYFIFRDRRTSITIGIVVFSHWILDFIVNPAMPIWFSTLPTVGLFLNRSGLGLIISGILDFIILFPIGVIIYLITKKNKIKPHKIL